MSYAPKSCATALRLAARSASAGSATPTSTPSHSQRAPSGSYGRQSTMPLSSLPFSSRPASINAQSLSVSQIAKAGQLGPVRYIGDSNWSARVHRETGGDRLSGHRSSFAPTSYGSHQSGIPSRDPNSTLSPENADVDATNGEALRSEPTPSSANGNSSNRPHLLPSQTPLSPKEPERTLTPEEYDEWALDEFRKGRMTEGGISLRRL